MLGYDLAPKSRLITAPQVWRRAGLEWGLVDPIIIDSQDELKSESRWKDQIKPYHHQVTNLITFCRRLPVTLLADDVGLGKTISAGLIASELIARIAKILGPQWKEELESKFNMTTEERVRLASLIANRNSPSKVVWRARIVLVSADGEPIKAICRVTGKSKPCVWRWQKRFAEEGVDGLLRDKTRPPGRKPLSSETKAKVLAKTARETPPDATHWSVRTMAKAMGVSRTSVQRIWAEAGLKPHLTAKFKVPNDPHFEEKVTDIVGLYMNPPDHALVLCVDEKSQIQCLSGNAKTSLVSISVNACRTGAHRSPFHALLERDRPAGLQRQSQATAYSGDEAAVEMPQQADCMRPAAILCSPSSYPL